MSSRNTNDPKTPQGALANYLDELLHSATSRSLDEEPVQASETAGQEPVQGRASSVHASRETVRQVVGQRTPIRTQVAVLPKVAPPPLRVAPAPLKVEPEAAVEVRAKVELKKPVPQPPPKVAPPAVEAPPAVKTPKAAPKVVETVNTVPAQTEAPTDGGSPEEPAGRPDWSRHAFECLLFKVAGLQLAVPLVLLGAIHRIDRELTELPGRPRWFMGMLPIGERNIRVVDTAAWVMSGRYPEGCAEQYKFVIRLDDSDWGLACDEVAQSFTLDPDDVKWRQSAGKRPWLAGTVVKHMCALIDVGAMANLLARAERERHLDLN